MGFGPMTSSLPRKCTTPVLRSHKGKLKTTPCQSVTTPKFIVCENEMKSSIGYIAWRRRQDSNLHVLAGERFSRPWQYQLCLLLHMG